MFKKIFDTVWAFDVEWVPDQLAGRLLYGIDEDASEQEIVERMWKEAGATEDDPAPFLKTIACRIVSIAAVERRVMDDGDVRLLLVSLPRDVNDPAQTSERYMIQRFLNAVGEQRPQLVGFNSASADLKILIQRALVNRVRADGFNRRPNKPWEGVDYYVRDNDCHVDIKQVVSGWGKGTPSLHELATLCGVPGKFDMDGDGVAASWLRGEHQKIVDYNECDAITTYLVWLRLAYFGGWFTEPQYDAELDLVRELIDRETAGGLKPHLQRYRAEWERLEQIIERHHGSMAEVGTAAT